MLLFKGYFVTILNTIRNIKLLVYSLVLTKSNNFIKNLLILRKYLSIIINKIIMKIQVSILKLIWKIKYTPTN